MTFVPVEKLPEKQKNVAFHNGKAYLEEFMRMGVKYARVDLLPGEYCTVDTGYHALMNIVKWHAFPITVKTINGEIYLIRKDLEDPNEQL